MRHPTIGEYVQGLSPARRRLVQCENQRFMAHQYGVAVQPYLDADDAFDDNIPHLPPAGTLLREIYLEHLRYRDEGRAQREAVA